MSEDDALSFPGNWKVISCVVNIETTTYILRLTDTRHIVLRTSGYQGNPGPIAPTTDGRSIYSESRHFFINVRLPVPNALLVTDLTMQRSR